MAIYYKIKIPVLLFQKINIKITLLSDYHRFLILLDDNIIEHSFPKIWRTKRRWSTAPPIWGLWDRFSSTRTMGRLRMSTRSPEKLEVVLKERSGNDVLDRAKKPIALWRMALSFLIVSCIKRRSKTSSMYSREAWRRKRR